MPNAVDRLASEIDDACDRVTARILEEVPAYRDDPLAASMLGPYVRQNADEAIRALRGEPTTMAAARNVGLSAAIGTSLDLDAVLRAYAVARDAFVDRLRALAADGEDVSEAIRSFHAAYAEATAAVGEAYLAAKSGR